MFCTITSSPVYGEGPEPPTSHWSTKHLVRPELPARTQSDWIRNPVDAFVSNIHQEHGLSPSAEADRRTLIRRLTYDLHGLPPEPKLIDAFIADEQPDAYERLVDRLLASPRYGERWARHWLDVAHYGETHGFDKDQRRDNAWPYRDYVIRSLNEDKPYAEFVREQIAGDLLHPDEPEGIIATGFLAAGPWDQVGQQEVRDGTIEKRRVRNLDRDDVVTNVFNTFMSTTVQCARCHDHKFDPVSLDDYYNLQSVFADFDRGDRDYEPADHAKNRRKLRTEIADKKRERADLQDQIDAYLPEWYSELEKDIEKWNSQLTKGTGDSSPSNGYHSVVRDTPDQTEWVHVELLEPVAFDRIVLIPARPTDYADTPGFGFPLRFHVSVSDNAEFDDATVVMDSRESDFTNPGDEPLVIDNPGVSARFIRVTAHKLWERNQDFVFALAELEVFSDGDQVAHERKVTANSSIEFGRWGAARLVDGYSSRAPLRTNDAEAIKKRNELDQKIAKARTRLDDAERSSVPSDLIVNRERLNSAIARLNEEEKALPKAAKVYAINLVEERPVFVLHRGEVANRLDPAQPAALRHVTNVATELAYDDGEARAALSEWITNSENGLTWRSIANRVWQYHFGQGLVSTPNDFGWAGEEPTHPQLLDWLAVELRDANGSLKHLHRVIVTSATYRQQSLHDEVHAAIDAQNRYLWRMNRRKLEAEAVRDAVLTVSGTMDFAMYGPPVELFNYTHDHSPRYDYVANDDPAVFRRSIYRYVVRSVPDPLFEAFDCADPNFSTPKRHETLTAQQALTLMNDAFILQQAEHFAERLRAAGRTPREQVTAAYLIALNREPSRTELKKLTAFTKSHGTENMARLVFNLNEFLFVD
jgi:hypothetical protein